MRDNYLNDRIPAEIAENLKEKFPEFDDLNNEEFLQHQDSVYRSLQENRRKEGESSRGESAESQLALDEALARILQDEALARALQELGEDFGDFCISEHSGTAAGSTELIPTETPVGARNQAVRQDDVDPDNMTYEELLSLCQTVGTENKRRKCKAGESSKKKKEVEQVCVICLKPCKREENLKALRCAHIFHSKCINVWLKKKKQCPVCRKKV